MKRTLLEEQEIRLKMIQDTIHYIDDYDLVLTYPSQEEEFKEDLKTLFYFASSKYNILINYQKLRERLKEVKT